MNIRAILFAATFLAAAPAFGQQIYQPIPNPLFTLGTTPVAPRTSVTALSGLASLGITAPVANTTALTLSGLSHTGSDASSDVSITGTWNTTGSPVALLINITNTASGANALLADFQIGGTDQFIVAPNKVFGMGTASTEVNFYKVTSNWIGLCKFPCNTGALQNSGSIVSGSGSSASALTPTGVALGSTAIVSFGIGAPFSQVVDTGISRDAAGVLDIGNGTFGNKSGSLNLAGITASGANINFTGLSTTPGAKQPLCIDTTTGQVYKGNAGAC